MSIVADVVLPVVAAVVHILVVELSFAVVSPFHLPELEQFD